MMTKFKLFYLILLFPLTIFASDLNDQSILAQNDISANTTATDNVVCAFGPMTTNIYNGSPPVNTVPYWRWLVIQHISVTRVEDYTITKGEPWKSIKQDGNCLNFRAGISKSADNVEWVKRQLKAMGIPRTTVNSGVTKDKPSGFPARLYFAAKVDLLIDNIITCPNIIIGEGYSSSFHYNWWIFPNIDNTNFEGPNNSLRLNCAYTTSGSQVYVYFYRVGANIPGNNKVGGDNEPFIGWGTNQPVARKGDELRITY